MTLTAQCRAGHDRLLAYAGRNLWRFVAALLVADFAGALVWLRRALSNLERAAALRVAACHPPRRDALDHGGQRAPSC